jgi:hypothetical protein
MARTFCASSEAVNPVGAVDNAWTASATRRMQGLLKSIPPTLESAYGPRRAAYDLKKLRRKGLVRKIGSSRRYETQADGLRAMTALVVLREKVIKPLLAAQPGARVTDQAEPSHNDRSPLRTSPGRHARSVHCAGDGRIRIDNLFSSFPVRI